MMQKKAEGKCPGIYLVLVLLRNNDRTNRGEHRVKAPHAALSGHATAPA